ncbi:MAG: hypothetical protein QGG97_03450 [Flavobacteriales bacterium]|jgi:cell division protein FtsQ|nr:hypothetical protein [Flavobacteriales bacterium]MDP7430588.1 hypothetical protein [Flavobacteriales bacterium]HJN64258.1 hypothetical protein [Flavobacteriales bacterium]|tara:strand:- start:3607 stop:4329 length:723 start_codon:yes stop_codon:yes gene_type:complete
MKKAFEILSWLMLIAVIVLLMAFSVKNQQIVECQKFEVVVASSENHFINDKMINELLSNKNLHPLGKIRAEIAMDEIEKSIGNHTSIKEVNAYFDIAGNVFVEILQRNPIARVETENNSFYIDENGKRMPLSKVYTARRLVITGKVNFQEKGDLFLLAKFINENPFWKAQIMQIHTEENGELILIPRVGSQQIVFGKPINIATKFSKLKLFYEKGILERGWNNYSHINLKFKNQIVCTKK